MISAKGVQTRVIPWNSAASWEQIDRSQGIDGDLNLNRNPRYELGRENKVDYKKNRPEFRYSLKQFEFGNMSFFRRLANVANSVKSITQADFKTSKIDLAEYLTEDDATVSGTLWLPKLRTSRFSLNIGAPSEDIERSFELVGEHWKWVKGNNKYLIYVDKVCETGESGSVAIVMGAGDYVNYPTPVVNPDVAGQYILKVLRIRSGVVAELVETTNYTYVNGTKTLTFLLAAVGDMYRVIYSASSYISGGSIFTDNDVDPGAISADNISIYLNVSNYAHLLQSAGLEVSFDRTDYSELGTDEIQQTGFKTTATTINLDKYVEGAVIEEILRGESAGYGLIDARMFAENIKFQIKIYSDSTKETFVMGYEVADLTPSNLKDGVAVQDVKKRTFSLMSDNILITDDESEMSS
jgi:hypothetical protein